jgi:hypothetical protein
MPRPPFFLSKEKLIELYTNDPNSSERTIAEQYGVNRATIGRLLKKHGIEAKPHARCLRPRVSSNPFIRDREWLREQYVVKKRSLRSIALEIGAAATTIKQTLEAMGIETRGIKVALDVKYPEGRFGAQASNWRGGRRLLKSGYVYRYKPDHPHATKDGYVMEHRLEMEKKLGRYLRKDEDVDHENTDKSDNRPENLEVLTRKEHSRKHFDDRKRVMALKNENEHLRSLLLQHGISPNPV